MSSQAFPVRDAAQPEPKPETRKGQARRYPVLRYEIPFAVPEPALVNPQAGIAQVRRRGSKHSFTMQVTLLDTMDNRLLRAGIVLAHRVVDGLGEWYLDAPSWQPWLPANRREQSNAVDELPQELASLVRPFRRRAPLGPTAALTRRQVGWQLLDEKGHEVATVTDARTSIRQGGVTTARFREVEIHFTRHTTRREHDHVLEAIGLAGGSAVADFPTLVERLGAPATGLSDFRAPAPRRDDSTLEGFVSWLFARRLGKVMRADLELRSGGSDDMDALRAQLAELRREVRSLSFALEPQWCQRLIQGIDEVLASLASRSIHQLGEEYFDVLDALVLAVRAPRLGDASQHLAVAELRQQSLTGAAILVDRARSLTLTSPDDRWAAVLASARQMAAVAHTNRLVFGKRAKKMERELTELLEVLEAAQARAGENEPRIDLEWDAVVAFQEGRRYERRRQELWSARERFIELWPDFEQRLRELKRPAPGERKAARKKARQEAELSGTTRRRGRETGHDGGNHEDDEQE